MANALHIQRHLQKINIGVAQALQKKMRKHIHFYDHLSIGRNTPNTLSKLFILEIWSIGSPEKQISFIGFIELKDGLDFFTQGGTKCLKLGSREISKFNRFIYLFIYLFISVYFILFFLIRRIRYGITKTHLFKYIEKFTSKN